MLVYKDFLIVSKHDDSNVKYALKLEDLTEAWTKTFTDDDELDWEKDEL